MHCLKRLIKHLLATQDYVQELRVDSQTPQNTVCVTVDAKWASSDDRRSTSGGVIRLRGLELRRWSRTQPVVTQSTCES
eukprot:8220344-Heterocapsa_arctica.AAC.1